MFSDSFLGATSKLIEEKLEAVKDAMASGSLRSMEEYREAAGKILAYRDSLSLLKETYSKYFEEITIYSGRDENGYEEKKY